MIKIPRKLTPIQKRLMKELQKEDYQLSIELRNNAGLLHKKYPKEVFKIMENIEKDHKLVSHYRYKTKIVWKLTRKGKRVIL